jgi:hypothetical protein
VLLINNSPEGQTPLVSLSAATLGPTAAAAGDWWTVRDIWERRDVGIFSGSFAPALHAYDSGFYLLAPVSSDCGQHACE